ncbi:hypothetical protein PCANC_14955 [Puccinia coronata f. sp. avenae]|uniref:Uncharacterized protein n=1 Tax=Puccinia coronata f. sp. avenae TaxID=200324 RepID=A0A2N5T283_9BASI|nr:hypothetical protein PCANC_14955 [Puccinia coronata f. sp. avenae]
MTETYGWTVKGKNNNVAADALLGLLIRGQLSAHHRRITTQEIKAARQKPAALARPRTPEASEGARRHPRFFCCPTDDIVSGESPIQPGGQHLDQAVLGDVADSEISARGVISGSVEYIRSDVESGYVGSVCLASDIRGVRPRSQVYIE